MIARGTSFDAGADACPFVALELDRDRRSERPDYRHRCYAEPTPAPRTIAHQERYCLSPNFAGCPIFQDWAVRAAARPVPLTGNESRRAVPDARGSAAASVAAAGSAAAAGAAGAAAGATDAGTSGVTDAGRAGTSDAGVAGATGAAGAGASADAGASRPASEPWPDSMSSPAAPPRPIAPGDSEDLAGRSTITGDAPPARQLGAFDDDDAPAATAPRVPGADGVPPDDAPPDDAPSVESAYAPPVDAHGAERPTAAGGEVEPSAPVPAVLVGRSERARSSPVVDERVSREDVVPSWELDGRFGAAAATRPDRSGMLGRVLTAIAVIVILGLGVAAVILVPGLLNAPPGSSPRPSFAAGASPSRSPLSSNIAVVPTATSTAIATPTSPTSPPDPTARPTPGASPVLYRIRSGDTLAKIARRNDITVAELLAANPQITNPDHVEVGQIIVIPQPSATPAP